MLNEFYAAKVVVCYAPGLKLLVPHSIRLVQYLWRGFDPIGMERGYRVLQPVYFPAFFIAPIFVKQLQIERAPGFGFPAVRGL